MAKTMAPELYRRKTFPGQGRKPRQGVRRHDCGKIVRKDQGESPDQIISTVIAHRIKSGVRPESARDQRAGYCLGRLNLMGSITRAQYEAGMRYARTTVRYASVMGFPRPSPTSAVVMMVAEPLSSSDLDDLRKHDDPRAKARPSIHDDRVREAREAYDQAFGALRDLEIEQGCRILPTMNAVCIRDADIDEDERAKGDLRTGLNVLVRLWAIS